MGWFWFAFRFWFRFDAAKIQQRFCGFQEKRQKDSYITKLFLILLINNGINILCCSCCSCCSFFSAYSACGLLQLLQLQLKNSQEGRGCRGWFDRKLRLLVDLPDFRRNHNIDIDEFVVILLIVGNQNINRRLLSRIHFEVVRQRQGVGKDYPRRCQVLGRYPPHKVMVLETTNFSDLFLRRLVFPR